MLLCLVTVRDTVGSGRLWVKEQIMRQLEGRNIYLDWVAHTFALVLYLGT